MRNLFGSTALVAVLALGGAVYPRMAEGQTSSLAGAESIISSIDVRGNQRIEDATVLSYLIVREGQSATPEQINSSVQELFKTGLFRDVRIDPEGSSLIVTVEENPVVNQISIEGNDRISDDVIESGITSRERRVFTRAKAEADADFILQSYRRSGRYAATVEPKIIELPQNRVDLVFEISEGPLTEVERIAFVGNGIYSDSRLKRVISTDEDNFLNFLSSTSTFDPDRLEVDKQLLRRHYLSNGYADFELVSANAELSPDRSGFFITFVIEEGEVYSFGETNIISNAEGVETASLVEAITFDVGDRYDVTEVEDTIAAMSLILGEQGYAFTEINPVPKIDAEGRTIGVEFEVNEGERVFVERIDIEGNDRTLDRVVRREFELVEGDAFDALKLRRSRSNIRGLGFFRGVNIQTERGSADDRIVVRTAVEEQSTGQINFGVGFSTSENITGEVSITERNFLGRGQAVRARARISGSNSLYDFGFTEPRFLDRDVAVGFDIFRRETNDQSTSSFDTLSTGFRPRVSFPLGPDTRLSTRYSISLDEIVDVPANASPLIVADIGESLTSSLGYTLVHDLRDDTIEPTRGILATVSQDFAGLGGDAQYISTIASVKGYQPLFYDGVIGTLEIEGGAIIGYGDYEPIISDRFSLGGDSFRGFENAGIGPSDTQTGDNLGGKYYGVARAEVTFPLPFLPEEFGLSGGVFADAGTLWGLDTTSYVDSGGNTITVDDEAKLRASVGTSIFWSSPFGPVRLNFAMPLVKEDTDDEEFFRFSAGTRF